MKGITRLFLLCAVTLLLPTAVWASQDDSTFSSPAAKANFEAYGDLNTSAKATVIALERVWKLQLL